MLCSVVIDLPEDVSNEDLECFESRLLDSVQFAAFGLFKLCPLVTILQEVNAQ